VYPFKTVEAGAVVNSSIVWESRGSRSLFGRDGVRGIANVDISPELVVRLSMAWASTLDKGTTITVSRDTSRAARVLKRAVIIGFFDREGLDLPETGQRKIERLYHREDFRRVLAGEIGDIDFPARAVEQ